MVASSVSGASSVRSRASTASVMTPSKMIKPHMLGGSKNLMSERFRRERAEQTLLKTRQSLKAVEAELAPQVDELTKAVKIMQIEKHHQLDLDETSQQVLEELQQQINDIEVRETDFSTMLDDRLKRLQEQVQEDFRAENYELRVLLAQVQDSQAHLLAEMRLVQHDVIATKEFLSHQLETIDDAIHSLRNELARSKDQQALTTQSIQTRAVEMDDKLFALDKELLKFKLMLPSSISAQLPPKFSGAVQPSEAAKAIICMDGNRSSVAVTHKLGELSANLEAMKQEMAAYRSADRQQFDAITNRLRESSKTHQSLKRELDGRFHEIQRAYDSMVTKVPSELSRRFVKAQSQWGDELQAIRSRVDELSSRTQASHTEDVEVYDANAIRSMDAALHRQIERLDEVLSTISTLQSDMETICQGQETTVDALRSAVNRLETDVLGLYDWTKQKVVSIEQEVTFATDVLRYFQQHAKILPKTS